jgi:hypothetical protein
MRVTVGQGGLDEVVQWSFLLVLPVSYSSPASPASTTPRLSPRQAQTGADPSNSIVSLLEFVSSSST